MFCAPLQTWIFYGFAALIEVGIGCFLGHIFYRANQKTDEAKQWRWSSEDSRDMWMDAAKTMISAAGIAAALLASLSASARDKTVLSAIGTFSLKSATVCLVMCVCVSMFLILSLARGHEAAKARENLKPRPPGSGQVKEGPLTDFALSITLLAAFVALSSFFVGFLFLARIMWHI
jgi:hypothetical protein